MSEKKGVAFTQEAAQAQAQAAIKSIPPAIKEFRCPTCGRIFANLEDLKVHCADEHPEAVLPLTVVLHINDKDCEVLIEPHWTLHRALQFRLGLTGAKHMCDRGACGSCTVIMDGRAVLSCTTLAADCRWDAMQCGYCTPGFLVTAKALLDKNPNPSEDEIKEALAGNICICGTYPRHSTAILEAATKMSKGEW